MDKCCKSRHTRAAVYVEDCSKSFVAYGLIRHMLLRRGRDALHVVARETRNTLVCIKDGLVQGRIIVAGVDC